MGQPNGPAFSDISFACAGYVRDSTSSWGRRRYSRRRGDNNLRRQLATALEKFERIESTYHGGQPLELRQR